MNYMEGSGTRETPYRIYCADQLQYVNQELDACYKLVSDIDATNLEPEEFEPIGGNKNPFTGTFDGNNYEIRNLSIKQPEQNFIGLFGRIGDEGRVNSLFLTDSSIEGIYLVGGLVGKNSGEIESSYAFNVDVSGYKNVGGLVGFNSGKIDSSYAVNVDVPGEVYVGGLVGSNTGEVDLCYIVKVDVSGEVYVGGLAGCNRYGEVKLSYTVDNSVSGDKYTGNLLGYGSRESCFTMSSSDESNILDDADLILLIGNHRISYVIETKTLYLQIEDNKIYSRRDVSPIEIQSLVDKTEVVEMTDTFRSSLVATI